MKACLDPDPESDQRFLFVVLLYFITLETFTTCDLGFYVTAHPTGPVPQTRSKLRLFDSIFSTCVGMMTEERGRGREGERERERERGRCIRVVHRVRVETEKEELEVDSIQRERERERECVCVCVCARACLGAAGRPTHSDIDNK